MSKGVRPRILFSLSAIAGGGQKGIMNLGKQLGFTALVFAAVCGLQGEETMPRRKTRTTDTTPQAAAPADGTGNLSKRRREELIGKIGEIRAFLERSGDTNATRLITFAAELEKEVRQKKYGLVFEEHKERIDVELEHNLPVLTENKSRFIDKGGELNFLIEGDNLAALKLLEKTHRGKIDLIYIDPPYNTGNKDFIYNDSYVDKEDLFRHSKWCSFMEKRLRIAKRLLTNDGVLFISIDDNEVSQLRMLCDDIFDPKYYIGTIAWESKTKCQNTKTARKQFQRKWEYILLYKNKPSRFEFVLEEIGNHEYPLEDDNGCYRSKLIEEMTASGMRGRNTMIFPIKGVSPRDGFQWKYGKDTVKLYDDRGDLELIDGKPAFRVRPEDDSPKCKPFWSLLDKSYGTAETAKRELTDIIGEHEFETVKPSSLIKYLIDRVTTAGTSSTILDFFAGSGTTGHAVMKLNAEDGGKRKFILVTNNENGICEKVTYERLKRVITKEGYQARLKYYKVDYVPIEQKVYFEYADELLKHIRELVELENAIDFNRDVTIAIAVTDREFAQFVASEKKMVGKKAVYVGHDVLIGTKARKVLQGKGIEIRIIPEYYYAEQEG